MRVEKYVGRARFGGRENPAGSAGRWLPAKDYPCGRPIKNGSRGSRSFVAVIAGLAIANVHGDFKTETHFSNFWLGPHGDILFSLVGLTNRRLVSLVRMTRTIPMRFAPVLVRFMIQGSCIS